VTPALVVPRRLLDWGTRKRPAGGARSTLPTRMPETKPAGVARKTPPSRELEMTLAEAAWKTPPSRELEKGRLAGMCRSAPLAKRKERSLP